MSLNLEKVRQLHAEARMRPFEELTRVIHDLATTGVPIFVIQGVIDIPHVGHARYAQAARRLARRGGLVVACLESDESVRKNKGPNRPINPATDRARMVAEFRSVDLVSVYLDDPDYADPEAFLPRYAALKPATLLAATWDPNLEDKQLQALRTGLRIKTVPYRHENSTTRMLKAVGYE